MAMEGCVGKVEVEQGGSNTSTAKGKNVVLWQEQKQGWDFAVGLR